jgi:hypothetical protein
MPLRLSNEGGGARLFAGRLGLAAFHTRALDAAEVRRNTRLGPDGRGDSQAADVDEDAIPDDVDTCVDFANANQTVSCPN